MILVLLESSRADQFADRPFRLGADDRERGGAFLGGSRAIRAELGGEFFGFELGLVNRHGSLLGKLQAIEDTHGLLIATVGDALVFSVTFVPEDLFNLFLRLLFKLRPG